MFNTRRLCWRLVLGGTIAIAPVHAEIDPLKWTGSIPLPGVEGRIDHFAYDARGQRLLVCALENNSVEIIDLHQSERIYEITGLRFPQGVAYIPDTDRIFVANDGGGICRTYDGRSFEELAEISLGDDADNVRYDEAAKKIYVGFGKGALAIADALTGKRTGSIDLGSHPEGFALEKTGKRIFVNVPNSRHVAVVDRDAAKVISKWNTDLAFGNFPMGLDETNHRLFVGCRMPSRLVVLNTDSGEVASKVEISGDTDDVFYDVKRHRLYVICGAGKIDVVVQKDANSYQTIAKIDTAAGARTGMFVPQLDTLFVAVPHRGSQGAEIRAYHVQ